MNMFGAFGDMIIKKSTVGTGDGFQLEFRINVHYIVDFSDSGIGIIDGNKMVIRIIDL